MEWMQTPSFGPEDEGLLLLPTEDELLEAVVEKESETIQAEENCRAETDEPQSTPQEGMGCGRCHDGNL